MKYLILIASLWATPVLAQIQAMPTTEKTITILQTADIHAYLYPHEELFVTDGAITFRKAGGLAQIKTLTEQIRRSNPEGTLLVDGGDLIQGSGESVRAQGALFPPLVRAMHYDLLIPGNWEVIYGKAQMLKLLSGYETPVIAANMFHADREEHLFPPYWITERQGLRIGFIAYNDPEVPLRQNPGYSQGIRFRPVADSLQALVQHLKQEERVDILLLITHLGISKQLMLANNPAIKGVDFILGNDTHERIRKPIAGRYAHVLEPGAFGSFVGRLDLKVADGTIRDWSYELIEVNPDRYPADPEMLALTDSLTAPYRPEMETVLGYTATPLYRYLVVENPMDNFITDALLWKTGVDFATSNGFRFGVPIIPDSTGRQAITQEDLWRMLPVDEHMKIGRVSGRQVLNWLEQELNNVFAENPEERFGGWLVRFSGMQLTFNSDRPKGQRIVSVSIQGAPLDPDRIYTMASCNRTGEPLSTMCRMPGAESVVIQDYTLHDAVKEYLKAKGTIRPRIDGRAHALDLDVQTFSQVPGTGYMFQ